MRAEIISIGTELLLGSILNTNARFLSQRLAENAIDVFHQATVGDNVDRIVQSFEAALKRSDIVIASGGLGPTEDDVTMQALSKVLGKPLSLHKPTYSAILNRLKIRKYRMTQLIARQCFVPPDSAVLQNINGTAPAVLCETRALHQKKWILVLPGPPRELEPLFESKALPLLLKKTGIKKEFFILRSLKIAGLVEAEVASKVTDLLKLRPPLTLGIYARPGEVELKIMAKSKSRKTAARMVRGLEKKIRGRLGNKIFGADSETLSSVIGELLKKQKKTLSVAESCTGGLLSNLITETSGSSKYYLGGIIAYSNRIKTKELCVRESLLAKHGAVSAQVAKEMAINARTLYKSNYAIAVTGIAGPNGGSPKKPVGLVYTAIASNRGVRCFKNVFFGNRTEIKSRAAYTALDQLRLNF